MPIGGRPVEYIDNEERMSDLRLQLMSVLDKSNLTTNPRFGEIVRSAEELLRKILDKFSFFVPDDMVLSLFDMISLHAGQANRFNGKTVIEHLLNTAILFVDNVKNPHPEEVTAALLHDAMEDRLKEVLNLSDDNAIVSKNEQEGAGLKRMDKEYGERVRVMLSKLIKPDYKKEIYEQWGVSDVESDEFRKAKSNLYVAYIEKALSNPDVAMIKLFDFVSNSSDVDSIPDEAQKEKVKSKYSNAFPVIFKKLSDPEFSGRLKDPDKLRHQLMTIYERFYREGQY